MRVLVVIGMLGLVACGPSAAELKTAREASYTATPEQMLAIAERAAAETYQIGEVSASEYTFMTRPRWYSPEGDLQGVGAGNFVQAVDRSVQVAFVVQIVPMNRGEVMVTVEPRTLQWLSGSPKPRELPPDDPNLPPWVHGRVDALVLAIHRRAAKLADAPPP